MHRIFRVKAYEAEHGPHFGCQGGLNDYGYGYGYGYNNGCGC